MWASETFRQHAPFLDRQLACELRQKLEVVALCGIETLSHLDDDTVQGILVQLFRDQYLEQPSLRLSQLPQRRPQLAEVRARLWTQDFASLVR